MRVNTRLTLPVFIALCILVTWSSLAFSTAHFDFNKKVENCYTSVMSLKLDEAQSTLLSLKPNDPDNLAYDFIEDYSDFLKVYLSEDRSLFKILEPRVEVRLDRLSDKTIAKSPYTHYVRAEILLHWGLIHLKFGNYMSAFSRIKKAYHLLNLNLKEFPQFSPNLKSLGVLHGLLSAIPDELKWIIKTLGGMEGNINQAKFELEQVMLYSSRNEYIFKSEALSMYGLLVANFDNDPASAWNLIHKSTLDPGQSPLFTYIFANLAFRNGENDLCIQYLLSTPKGPEYFRFPYLDYMLGLAKLRRLDQDASVYFKKYLTEFKGIHFIKECYQKLGWIQLIQGNIDGYKSNMLSIKKYGANVMDQDKQARREADLGIIPQVTLLKARLLSDGGYLKRALEMIDNDRNVLVKGDHALEANYRLGRIYHQDKKYDQAIAFYLQTIAQGTHSQMHYACAASLYTGMIYEYLHQSQQAKFYFKKCLSITPGDYSYSLHQKAKAGLNRLTE